MTVLSFWAKVLSFSLFLKQQTVFSFMPKKSTFYEQESVFWNEMNLQPPHQTTVHQHSLISQSVCLSVCPSKPLTGCERHKWGQATGFYTGDPPTVWVLVSNFKNLMSAFGQITSNDFIIVTQSSTCGQKTTCKLNSKHSNILKVQRVTSAATDELLSNQCLRRRWWPMSRDALLTSQL